MLKKPAWLKFGSARRRLQFIWDDTRVDEDFTGDASAVLGAALKMSVRARMVLAVGFFEWIVWRFDGLHERTEPKDVLAAAWCACVDPRYLNDYEFTRDEWEGPIEGPLWCAMTYLQHGLPKGYDLEGDLYDVLELLYLLVAHVTPKDAQFERWLRPILKRLVQHYPLDDQPEIAFDDLFDRHVGERLGELIGRDALAPNLPLDPARARIFLGVVLAEARDTENPFVTSPEDLEEQGFEGALYSVTP
jgi:hypothetical protein